MVMRLCILIMLRRIKYMKRCSLLTVLAILYIAVGMPLPHPILQNHIDPDHSGSLQASDNFRPQWMKADLTSVRSLAFRLRANCTRPGQALPSPQVKSQTALFAFQATFCRRKRLATRRPNFFWYPMWELVFLSRRPPNQIFDVKAGKGRGYVGKGYLNWSGPQEQFRRNPWSRIFF